MSTVAQAESNRRLAGGESGFMAWLGEQVAASPEAQRAEAEERQALAGGENEK